MRDASQEHGVRGSADWRGYLVGRESSSASKKESDMKSMGGMKPKKEALK